MSRAVAAIDIGTNSTNVLVLDAEGRELDRIVNITRLGRGVDASRRLSSDAIERTCAVLREYSLVLGRHGVDPARDLRVTTTSAARDAVNRDEFFASVEAAVGRRPDLLSGDEEGRLAHRGAVTGLSVGDGWHVLVDIGGGSTELVLGQRSAGRLDVRAVRSLDVGAVRLTERYLAGDPPAIEFDTLLTTTARTSSMTVATRRQAQSLRVPVARAARAEAGGVVDRFQARLHARGD